MKLRFTVLGTILLVCNFLSAQNRITIEITSSTDMKTGACILISAQKTRFFEDFSSQLSKDLINSDWFEVKNLSFKENFYIQSEIDEALSKNNASVLIVCKNEEKLRVQAYDTLEKNMLFEFSMETSNSPVQLAHRVSDEIVQRITGKPGIATSKIIYITRQDSFYKLAMADYDGSNPNILLSAEYIINYPRWFPDKKKILFLSYRKTFPSLESIDLTTRQIKTFVFEPGLNACASFFRNKNQAVVVLSKSGRPDIYLVDLEGNILKRLTEKKGINASPSVSPDGKQIAFVSDRDGKVKLWVMNPDGLNVRKIDIPSNYVTAPAWSPDGEYLAYSVRYGTQMFIETYHWPTGKKRLLTSSISWAEAPSWAPDSRHILFTRQQNYINSLWCVDIYSLRLRKVVDNAWSSCWDVH